MTETLNSASPTERKKPYISLTSWCWPASLSERHHEGRPARGEIHVVIPHGKGERLVTIEVTFDECLALCANAADAARMLKNVRDE